MARMGRRRAWAAAALVVSLLVGGAAPAAESPEKAAEASAGAWLAIVDAGRYGESWEAAAPLFRSALSRPQWEDALKKVRAPLGRVLSRKLHAAQYTTTLPNAPAGEYVVIQYDTSFEKRKSAVETVTPMKDNGAWRVSGYYIK